MIKVFGNLIFLSGVLLLMLASRPIEGLELLYMAANLGLIIGVVLEIIGGGYEV